MRTNEKIFIWLSAFVSHSVSVSSPPPVIYNFMNLTPKIKVRIPQNSDYSKQATVTSLTGNVFMGNKRRKYFSH